MKKDYTHMIKRFKKYMNYNSPPVASMEVWNEWENNFEKNAPIRYFINKKLPIPFKNIKYSIQRKLYWIRYRTTRRYHIIKTDLEPDYYDIDTRMLHANFSLLVEYVEHECAWMNIVFDKEKYENALGWKRYFGFFRKRFFSKKLGLDYLDWCTTLDDPNLPKNEQSIEQAKSARIIKRLYLWWTETRPNRKEPDCPVDFCDMNILRNYQKFKTENPQQYREYQKYIKDLERLETRWDKEDEKILIELIKIRKSLWT